MIKLDKSYSDYTDETDGKYPAGKAVNASSSESYDGTPWLAEMMNDEHGARQAIYKAAYGSVDGLSGVPDNVDQSDTLKAIRKLIDDPDKAHANSRGSNAHGATVKASPGQIVTRDEIGRAKVAAPLEDDDIARKAEVDAAENRAKNLANATGVLAVAKGGTGKTTAKGAQNALLSSMTSESSTPGDDSLFTMKYATPSDTNGVLYSRKASFVWEYIKGKISSVLGLTATSYGGKAATAGTADTAKACTGKSATAGTADTAKACTGNSATATKATQDGSGNNIVKTYATITALNNQIAAVKDALMPIGFVYTQWPLTKSPTELKFPGTWSDVSWKYKGLFPRVDGGDAAPFNKTLSVVSQSGKTLTFASGHGIIKGYMLINTANGEQRSVTVVSGNTVTIESAFSTTITTVLIGQSEGLPNIRGEANFRPISDASSVITNLNTGVFSKSEAYKKLTSGNYYGTGSGSQYNAVGVLNFDASLSNSIYGNSDHVTPNNATIKVWQRVS